ncbi:MAG: hypothetical protein AAGH60_12195 [Pseudomonadota bacterium]
MHDVPDRVKAIPEPSSGATAALGPKDAGDTAAYVAEMLDSLEAMAIGTGLDVLGAMLAMASEQARDDLDRLGRGQSPAQ